MRRVLVLALLAAALVAAPAARLAAAAPCAGPGAMDCCAGMGDQDAPPCHCQLKPVPPPAPAVMDSVQTPLVVPAEAPLAPVAVEARVAAVPAVSVAPRARSAPLNLLFSVLLV
ncbi:MAG TPA: hypothetical protein VMV60_13665 [Thermoanaerobaculia bacterium]|nr:hypothetical protein [Thermoanaerobaculia bacterium]